ncbi:hypothetical protein LTR66_007984 [Elasticomyces elasticus]|nr:hypothetical protein LTR66_007984 [Elasticomyces elasticus]
MERRTERSRPLLHIVGRPKGQESQAAVAHNGRREQTYKETPVRFRRPRLLCGIRQHRDQVLCRAFYKILVDLNADYEGSPAEYFRSYLHKATIGMVKQKTEDYRSRG